jgi:hypothetical protein
VKAALDHLQAAQNEIQAAQQDLSAVVGYTTEWTRLGKLHDRIRDDWYRLEAKRGKPHRGVAGQLDHSSITADGHPREDEHPHAGCRGRR